MADKIEERLWELEEKFWKRSADFFEQNLRDDCLMLFQAPVGMLTKDEAIETVSAGPRWVEVAFDEPQLVRIADNAVILAYRVQCSS